MSTLLERFEKIKTAAEKETANVQRIEARLEVKKEEVQNKKQQLADKGITFKNGAELRDLIADKEERVLDLVVQMEGALGISEDDEEEDDLLEDDGFDFGN